ncbi:hypothetical protein N7U66_17770 [Lacinutrix neustonica]|uniref:Uncharacterized protein n=1 Tax=Lacinutrix neustonica TaxID=2980107 RepID=A0A9E8MWT1_9FLAO|nr:hypothetical protein [Lacinutrix neustonica]WAC01725.1 hypothetical protein N7U66_17770 [Lacinutrix neustonica]
MSLSQSKKVALLLSFFSISLIVSTQESMKKIAVVEGLSKCSKYNELNIETLLQVYDNNTSNHLIGDMYLRVDNQGLPILDFFCDTNPITKEYNTKAYKNYFFTFKIENNNKYLIIEQAQFGKPFALSSKQGVTIDKNGKPLVIEITEYIHEWGYDGPPEDSNRTYFSDINYTLTVKEKEFVKHYSFSSSEIKNNYTINLERYTISILNDLFSESSCLIEMIVTDKL